MTGCAVELGATGSAPPSVTRGRRRPTAPGDRVLVCGGFGNVPAADVLASSPNQEKWAVGTDRRVAPPTSWRPDERLFACS